MCALNIALYSSVHCTASARVFSGCSVRSVAFYMILLHSGSSVLLCFTSYVFLYDVVLIFRRGRAPRQRLALGQTLAALGCCTTASVPPQPFSASLPAPSSACSATRPRSRPPSTPASALPAPTAPRISGERRLAWACSSD